MKSANADEIFGFASDEIKSTHSPSRRISSNEVGFHRRRRFHPPARVDLVENDKFLSKLVVFWYGRQDLNLHGNPLEPKSNVSANSTTPAFIKFSCCNWLGLPIPPVAVPDKIFGLSLLLDFIDRGHSLRSLFPPPAALPSLPTSAYFFRVILSRVFPIVNKRRGCPLLLLFHFRQTGKAGQQTQKCCQRRRAEYHQPIYLCQHRGSAHGGHRGLGQGLYRPDQCRPPPGFPVMFHNALLQIPGA